MKKIALLAVAAAAIVTGPALQARERLTGEQQLAKLLEGRVAGEPVDCISLSSARDSRIIDKTAIVYESGRVIYVNRPRDARWLDDDDILVTQTHTSELCSIDSVRLLDRSSHTYAGFVSLEQFVPYRRVALRD